MADVLRERCCATSPRGEDNLPVVHPKWRRGRRTVSPARRAHVPHHGASSRLVVARALLCLAAAAVLLRAGTRLFAQPEPELDDLRRLQADGAGLWAAAATTDPAAANEPMLIPRLIHQRLPAGGASQLPLANSWRRLNTGWELRLYSEQGCQAWVRREFPEYWETYRRLDAEERTEFFSYMVILRHGGVYAAADTECRRPMDGLLHSKDTLVAGWDNEFQDAAAAVAAGYVRLRQLAPWAFAGAPGHPALRELCTRIAASASKRRAYTPNPGTQRHELSGAGLFTDVLLRHAAAHPPSAHDDPWGVRLLPRVRFGAPLKPAYGLTPGDLGVAVLHHGRPGSQGDEDEEGSSFWAWPQAVVQCAVSRLAARWSQRSSNSSEAPGPAEARRMAEHAAATLLYPVSVDTFDPPFDLLTHLVGRGERQSGADVGAALTTHGGWQPSVQPSRRPSLLDVLVGSLGGGSGRNNVLVDVGAGYGLVTLAAAARGHRVHAFELGPASLEALEASLAHNGFEHLVQVHKEPLGSLEQEGYTCVMPRHAGGASAAAAVDVNVQRGYGPAEAHATPAEGCQLMTRRTAGAWAVPEGDRIAALRVSANGWEGFVLKGFAPLLKSPARPPVLAVEWDPAAMKAAGWKRPLQLLEWLHSLGYRDISHSGLVCDQRWYSITYGIRRRGGITPEDLAALQQPTWCRLQPQHFSLLADRGAGGSGGANPETLLLVHHGSDGEEADGGGSSGGARSGGSGKVTGPGSGTGEFVVPDVVAQALAEAALMVSDAAANHAAAAVSDLSAGDAANASKALAAAKAAAIAGEPAGKHAGGSDSGDAASSAASSGSGGASRSAGSASGSEGRTAAPARQQADVPQHEAQHTPGLQHVHGIVQGVFFRAYTVNKAKQLGLVGYCANMPQGTVKGEVQGRQQAVEEMKGWLNTTGSPHSVIERCDFSNERQLETLEYSTFDVRRRR
ncbi:glycosyltransferase family 32 [Micractinium conductrix]|uniref:acylphosphatase n=1 Tax=Micractinium conductrix TaxID=554055 RepID=A0A2P6VR72_9CHLO|nr:glycosyltransferase family 32 [Micractinium conductrix]|eukprot:PSC76567.1 glycosyltransferase family 32 [Micractinium conductrix]